MRPPSENPIPLGSLYNIAKLMGLRDSGRTYRDIKQAITSGGKSSKSPEVLIMPNQPRNYAEPPKIPSSVRHLRAAPLSGWSVFTYSARSKTDLPLSLGFIQLPTKTLWASHLSRDAKVLPCGKNTVVCGKDYRGLWQGLPWFVARITVVCGKKHRGLWQGLPWFVAKKSGGSRVVLKLNF